MEHIERAALEYAEPIATYTYFKGMDDLTYCDLEDCIAESFKEGVEFAQRWIQIDRCTNGYITAHSLSDIERNLPVIMNDEDGVKDDEYVIIRYISDLLDMDESFTHWRPINLK